MTAGVSATLANSWLDTDFATAGCYIQLHIGDPGAAGTANVSNGSTARVQATMAAASAGSKAMTSMASIWTNGGANETLTHISVWSLASGGTFKGSAPLSSNQAWQSTNTFTLTVLSFAFTPIAA